jgi:hypothetical protein
VQSRRSVARIGAAIVAGSSWQLAPRAVMMVAAPGKGHADRPRAPYREATAVAESERKLAWVALQGDARAFRALYDVAFRLSWAFAVRSTGDARLAEAVTARALRRVFAELSALADARTSLGALVLGCADEALRELEPQRAAAAPPIAAAGK